MSKKLRKIIKIDQDKCIGCTLCTQACQEGAIAMVNGKAQLIRDDYCDGLGNCLPKCPTGAISFEEREADAFNEEAVAVHLANRRSEANQTPSPKSFGCPSMTSKTFSPKNDDMYRVSHTKPTSQLRQFPIQIQLVPPNAPFFDNADLLIAADCTAFAYGDFHNEFMKDKITIIGCPKLDNVDYSDKLTEILAYNEIKSLTIVRMEVPCCSGIVSAVKTALRNSDKLITWSIVTISRDGKIIK